MKLFGRIKRAVAGDFREFIHAVKNPRTYTVPGDSNWDDLTPQQKRNALEQQRRVRNGEIQ